MNDALALVFDVGTQSVRAMLFDAAGHIVRSAQDIYEQPYYSRNPNWAEQRPDFYFEHICIVSQRLKDQSPEDFARAASVAVTVFRDTTVCMGASVSGLHGFNIARGRDSAKNSVAVIGDSTFCHSGVTGLMDIAYNQGISTVIVLDNSITGMTGHQNNPANGLTIKGDPTVAVNLEALAHALGINSVRVVDPFDIENVRKTVAEDLEKDEPSLVISRRPCALLKNVKHKAPVTVNEKCIGCKACLRVGCPALSQKDGRAAIDATQCVGCGVCASACRFGAIV